MSVSVAVGRDHYPVTLSPLRTALEHDYNINKKLYLHMDCNLHQSGN